MEIKKDFKNSLFKRQEISGELESEKNPSFEEVKQFVSEKLNKPEETIKILNIKGGFGKDNFHVDAHIYDSKEDLETMNNLTKTKKQRTEEAKAKEDAKAEADKPKDKTTTKEIKEEPKTEDTPTEEKTQPEQKEDTPSEEPKTEEQPKEQTPPEDKSEEENKARKEETQKAEEAKEN
jgi:ribosomal protein S24E